MVRRRGICADKSAVRRVGDLERQTVASPVASVPVSWWRQCHNGGGVVGGDSGGVSAVVAG